MCHSLYLNTFFFLSVKKLSSMKHFLSFSISFFDITAVIITIIVVTHSCSEVFKYKFFTMNIRHKAYLSDDVMLRQWSRDSQCCSFKQWFVLVATWLVFTCYNSWSPNVRLNILSRWMLCWETLLARGLTPASLVVTVTTQRPTVWDISFLCQFNFKWPQFSASLWRFDDLSAD